MNTNMHTKHFRLVVLAGLILTAVSVSRAAEANWLSLFDGKTLDGWAPRGGDAKFTVEDGCIVGHSSTNPPNTFLCTTKDYTNFILELEFKDDERLNSGVQLRSHCFDKETIAKDDQGNLLHIGTNTAPIKVPAGRVHGYQVEIDPTANKRGNWTGGIYDEARRLWLVDLKNNPEPGKVFHHDDWNKFHIEARNGSIKTWINGVPAADLKDSATAAGFIGLQVHRMSTEGLTVRFRNLRIQILE